MLTSQFFFSQESSGFRHVKPEPSFGGLTDVRVTQFLGFGNPRLETLVMANFRLAHRCNYNMGVQKVKDHGHMCRQWACVGCAL